MPHLDPEVLGALLALLAHDLRNPLSALHSNIGFLSATMEDVDEETRGAFDDALVSCEGIAAIIDNSELVSQWLQSSPARAVEPLLLEDLVNEVVHKCSPFARSHDVPLEVDQPSLAGLRGKANRDLAGRALGNLIRNGVQHASGGTVTVRGQQQAGRAAVMVQDDGAPVAEDLKSIIFSPEGQVASKSRPGGRYSRGLGLLAAKIAADGAGCVIEIVERPRGSCLLLAFAT